MNAENFNNEYDPTAENEFVKMAANMPPFNEQKAEELRAAAEVDNDADFDAKRSINVSMDSLQGEKRHKINKNIDRLEKADDETLIGVATNPEAVKSGLATVANAIITERLNKGTFDEKIAAEYGLKVSAGEEQDESEVAETIQEAVAEPVQEDLEQRKAEAIERIGHDVIDPTGPDGKGLRADYFSDRDLLGMQHQEYRLRKDQIIQDDLSPIPRNEEQEDAPASQVEQAAEEQVSDKEARIKEIRKRIKEIDPDRQDLTDEEKDEIRELTKELTELRGKGVKDGQKQITGAEQKRITGEVIGDQKLLPGEVLDPAAEIAEREKRIKEIEEEQKKLMEELGPLVAINADFTADKKDLARDVAETKLNNELSGKGFLKRLWKGTWFKKAYEYKYRDEAYESDEVDDKIKKRSGAAIERFTLAAVTGYDGFIHKIGKKGGEGEEKGEKLTPADEHTTEIVKGAIEKYLHDRKETDKSTDELMREFSNEIGRIKAEARDRGEKINENLIDNYFEVAQQAWERVEHGVAIDRVTEGFKVYNAEVHDGVRTEAHRDAIDKIVNKVESSKIGRFIPAEAVAIAASTAWALTQTGARAAAGAGIGIGISGVVSGLKERNRVAEDRARMMRDVANGLEYESDGGKRNKYEEKLRGKLDDNGERIGGALYNLQKASDLTENLTRAMDGGNSKEILQAIAEAKVRIEFSDSESKDLIAYSSADQRGSERLALDKTVYEAMAKLSDEDKQVLSEMEKGIQSSIEASVEKSDARFRKLRTARVLGAAGKTVALGALTFFGSQEIMAAFDPTKIGLLEKLGVLKTQNGEGASETILAGLAGPRVEVHTNTEVISDVSGDNTTSIKRYEDAGYEKIEKSGAWTEKTKDIQDVRPENSVNRLDVKYDGWANNGTTVSDGNELGLGWNADHDGFVVRMAGDSTMNGQAINFDATKAAGDVKALVTIGGAKFEAAMTQNAAGQFVFGDNGVITTTTGETIKILGDNGEKLYKYIEIVKDNGMQDGVMHIMPFATDVGRDTFEGTIQQVVESTIEHPATYDFVKTVTTEVPRDVFYGGVVAPIFARRGIGEAKPVEQETAPANNPTEQVQTREQAREALVGEAENLGGSDGIDLMTQNDPENYSAEAAARYEAWWNSLDNEARMAMAQVMTSSTVNQNTLNPGLRHWVKDKIAA